MDANPPEKKALKKANESKTCTNKTIAPMIGQVFMLYCILLMEEARQPWTKIIKEQIDSEPWTDHMGMINPRSMQSLEPPSWCALHSSWRPCSDMMRLKYKGSK